MIRGDQFTQRAQMQAEQGNNLVNMLQGLMQDRRKQQMLEQEMQMKREADLNAARKDAMQPEAILAKAATGGVGSLTPEEQGVLKAYDISRTTQMGANMLGNVYQKNRSVFDVIGGAGSQQGMRPEFALLSGAQPQSEQAMPAMRPEFSALMGGGVPAMSAGQLDEGLLSGAGIDPMVLRSPAVQADMAKELGKAQVEIEKDTIKEESEVKKDKKKALKNINLVDKMIELNRGTLSTPYAGAAQIGARFTNPKEAENYAVLRQLQLRLAAPLAKQLGVNPTDRDFKNTMEQIFNMNESRETRGAQLEMVKSILASDADISLDDFNRGLSEITNKNDVQGPSQLGVSNGSVEDLLNKYAPRN
jgi:hypothetical protein